MSPDSILALAGFAFVTSVTPGPSNLILLSASANFGLRRCIPLVFGINLSFLSMLLLVGFGLGQVLHANTEAYTGLKVLSLLYILWLAWKIARATPPPDGENTAARDGRPLSFLQMALLQWVNPKAWAVALTVTAAYTSTIDYTVSLLTLTAIFGMVNLPSISVWAVSGGVLRRLLRAPRAVRAFNLTMAVLLIASLVPILLELGR